MYYLSDGVQLALTHEDRAETGWDRESTSSLLSLSPSVIHYRLFICCRLFTGPVSVCLSSTLVATFLILSRPPHLLSGSRPSRGRPHRRSQTSACIYISMLSKESPCFLAVSQELSVKLRWLWRLSICPSVCVFLSVYI